MKSSKVLFTLVLLGAILGTASSSDAVSTKLYLQGRLTTAAGAYLANGTYPMIFNIYKAETGGAPLWSDTFTAIKVTAGGAFAVTLGSQVALPTTVLLSDKPTLPERVSVFTPESRWLEVVVDGEVFGPRVKINTSGYGANADTLDGLDSTKFSLTTHNHSLPKLTGTLLDTQIPAAITRDTELTAGLATKADVSHNHDGRYYTKAQVDTLTAALTNKINALETTVSQLTTLLANVSKSGNDLIFSGVNVRIVNGEGNTKTTNGRGNLIVGYNELRGDGDDRSGSHNIVGGSHNNYSSYGGLVAGQWNTVSAEYASVSGGWGNTASATKASVSGGWLNQATNRCSSVSGGYQNVASGEAATVGAGYGNSASGYEASVSGGRGNTASGNYASVSGGHNNQAVGAYSFVGGGGHTNPAYGNRAYANLSAVLGGAYNRAGVSTDPTQAELSTVSGGDTNQATGWASCVSGGKDNNAAGSCSTVSAGYQLTTSAQYGWAHP